MMKFYEKIFACVKIFIFEFDQEDVSMKAEPIPDGPSEGPIILDQFVNPFLASSYFISST